MTFSFYFTTFLLIKTVNHSKLWPLYLFEHPSYKLNELIVSQDLLTRFLGDVTFPSVFQLKVLRKVLETENKCVQEFVKKLDLNFEFSGIKAYFRAWYKQLPSKPVNIRFC